MAFPNPASKPLCGCYSYHNEYIIPYSENKLAKQVGPSLRPGKYGERKALLVGLTTIPYSRNKSLETMLDGAEGLIK